MIVDVYPGDRGQGKTTWLCDQITQAIRDGQQVAVVVPAQSHRINAPGDVYTERTFEHARGRTYDRIFVDNADLFVDDPSELCSRVAPGIPVTMTFTPSPFGRALPIHADRPNSPGRGPTLSQEEQEYLALLLAVKTGSSLRAIMESGLVTSAVADGLLWKMTHE